MGGHIAEVRLALAVARHPFAVVADRKEMLAVLAGARNRNGVRLGIDAVLDQLGNRLQRAALRQRDDRDCVPVIADLQPAARFGRLASVVISQSDQTAQFLVRARHGATSVSGTLRQEKDEVGLRYAGAIGCGHQPAGRRVD